MSPVIALLLAPLVLTSATPNLRRLDNTTDAVSALSIEIPNAPNSWYDKNTSLWYSQTIVFLNNTAKKAICDVKVNVPFSNTSDTKVFSSFVYDASVTRSGVQLVPASYAKRIEPGSFANFGFIVEAPKEEAVKGGDVKVADARWCDDKSSDSNTSAKPEE